MRAIALFLLGLLALTGASPACASARLPVSSTEHKAHQGCPETRDRTADHGCATATCVGCALVCAPAVAPAGSTARVPLPPTIAPTVSLAGLDPIVAIPPPRRIA